MARYLIGYRGVDYRGFETWDVWGVGWERNICMYKDSELHIRTVRRHNEYYTWINAHTIHAHSNMMYVIQRIPYVMYM